MTKAAHNSSAPQRRVRDMVVSPELAGARYARPMTGFVTVRTRTMKRR
jgi:hypothetical protein